MCFHYSLGAVQYWTTPITTSQLPVLVPVDQSVSANASNLRAPMMRNILVLEGAIFGRVDGPSQRKGRQKHIKGKVIQAVKKIGTVSQSSHLYNTIHQFLRSLANSDSLPDDFTQLQYPVTSQSVACLPQSRLNNHEVSRHTRLHRGFLRHISSVGLCQPRGKETTIYAQIEAPPTSLLVETR